MPRSRLNAGLFAAIVLVIVLLPAGYMGVYYAMLESQTYVVDPALADPQDFGYDDLIIPLYYGHNEWLEWIFTPANKLDRLIRPEYWGMIDVYPEPPPLPPDEF